MFESSTNPDGEVHSNRYILSPKFLPEMELMMLENELTSMELEQDMWGEEPDDTMIFLNNNIKKPEPRKIVKKHQGPSADEALELVRKIKSKELLMNLEEWHASASSN